MEGERKRERERERAPSYGTMVSGGSQPVGPEPLWGSRSTVELEKNMKQIKPTRRILSQDQVR